MKISDTLTAYGLCIENEFLEAYETLINSAVERNLVKCWSHSHHVIPVCYYEKVNGLSPNRQNRTIGLRLAKRDLNNFEVELTYEEHILAHCYLALASKEPWFTYANMIAIKLLGYEDPDPMVILGISRFPSAPIIVLDKKIKKDQKSIWMTKDEFNEQVPVSQLLEYLKSGWALGAKRRSKPRQTCSVWKASEEKTKKRRKKHEIKKIPVSELIDHLESGWNYGKGEN